MNQLVGLRTALGILDISKTTFYRIKTKNLNPPPIKKVGGRWKCDPVELQKWYEAIPVFDRQPELRLVAGQAYAPKFTRQK